MSKISNIISFLFILSLATGLANAQTDFAAEQEQKVIIVVGEPGTEEYRQEFIQWTQTWEQACSKGGDECVIIGLNEVGDTNDLGRLKDALSSEVIETKVPLWLVFIGHGTYDGREAKFNLRGRDVSDEVLLEWLEPITRPLVFIDASSSSAPFLTKLSAPGRIIITATKSGFELNYSRFGQYFADAIGNNEADIDKDGQTSLLEAFLMASNNVAEFYSDAGRLATEEALLDDNGDGFGTSADWFSGIRPVQRAANNAIPDGYTAHQYCLVKSEIENKIPPDLIEKRNQLEIEVIKLRDNQDQYSEDEYFSKLEELLYQIAEIYEQSENN